MSLAQQLAEKFQQLNDAYNKRGERLKSYANGGQVAENALKETTEKLVQSQTLVASLAAQLAQAQTQIQEMAGMQQLKASEIESLKISHEATAKQNAELLNQAQLSQAQMEETRAALAAAQAEADRLKAEDAEEEAVLMAAIAAAGEIDSDEEVAEAKAVPAEEDPINDQPAIPGEIE